MTMPAARPGLERGRTTSIFELLNGYEPSVELRQSSSIPDPIPLLALVSTLLYDTLFCTAGGTTTTSTQSRQPTGCQL